MQRMMAYMLSLPAADRTERDNGHVTPTDMSSAAAGTAPAVSLGTETLIDRKQIFSMQNYSFVPCGVCAKLISFSLENGKIHNLSFVNGCPGNLQAIGKLLEGEDATKAIRILKGNTCGKNSTSCADQLAIALEQALDKETAAGHAA